MSSNSILVTGASGQFGQLVLRHLVQTLRIDPQRIVAASRDTRKLSEWAEQGIEVRTLDFENEATFATAFAGVARVLLISTDALDQPGRRLAQHQNVIRGMETADVTHVTYLSAPNPEGAPLLIASDHDGTEKTLSDSGLPNWTVLRNHWYFENLFLFLPSAIASGKWFTADGGQGSADITRNDLALAAATVVSRTMLGKQVYTLSGAESLTKQKVASVVSSAIKKPIDVIQIPLESLVQGMVAAGFPEPLARVFASFDTNTDAGRVAQVTNDFFILTGLQPQTFESWVMANQARLAAL